MTTEAHRYHVDIIRHLTRAYPELDRMHGLVPLAAFYCRAIDVLRANPDSTYPFTGELVSHLEEKLEEENSREPLSHSTDADSRMLHVDGKSFIVAGDAETGYAIPLGPDNAKVIPLRDLMWR